MTASRRLTVPQARRIALAAQGFSDKPPSGAVTARHFRRVMARMTILQLDSVNVLCRSHFLPVFARLGSYDRVALDRHLYHSGDYFEFVAHEASIASQTLHPLLRHKSRSWEVLKGIAREHPEYVEAVFEQVAAEGPLSVKELDDPGGRNGPWWGLSKGKVALESLYVTGRLAIAERTPSFVTRYDLPENVIRPEVLAQPTPSADEAKRQMVALGLRSHGIGTANDIADYFRLKVGDTKKALADLVSEGRAEPVEVRGWKDAAFLDPEAKRPRSVPGRALLSPFDPVVWFRPRAERLFDFHYRIEIYVPEPKRVYGYYVLPFLLDGDLVARVDLKADRGAGLLRVRGAFAEPTVFDGAADVPVDRPRVAAELAESLADMARWLDLPQGVAVEPNGDLAPLLAGSGALG